MCHSQKQNVTISMVRLKNNHTYANISPQMVNPRGIAGTAEEEEEEDEEEEKEEEEEEDEEEEEEEACMLVCS